MDEQVDTQMNRRVSSPIPTRNPPPIPLSANGIPPNPRGSVVGSLARGGAAGTRIPPSLQAKMAAVSLCYLLCLRLCFN